jgi:PIN domain nuclease of toxin-antitoxin system
MRLLLDTHVLLWSLGAPHRLGPQARSEIEDHNNEVLFSAASIWEIAIKSALKRADFAVSPDTVQKAAIQVGFTELPVRSGAAARVASLASYHRDPFDRLLIAQALSEHTPFYTADDQLARYSELVRVIA